MERHEHHGRRAIWICDDSSMIFHIICVDLGDDEWHMRIHSECRRFVDRDGFSLARDWDIFSPNVPAGAEENDIDFLERLGAEFFYRDCIATELDGFSNGTGRTNWTQTCHRKTSAFQYTQQLSASGPGRTDDGDVITSHERSILTL